MVVSVNCGIFVSFSFFQLFLKQLKFFCINVVLELRMSGTQLQIILPRT